jgi:hypothetical protein
VPIPIVLYADIKEGFNPAEEVLTATTAPTGPPPAGTRRVKVQFIVGAGLTRQVDATNVKFMDVGDEAGGPSAAQPVKRPRGRPRKGPAPTLTVPERGVVAVPVHVLKGTPRPPSEAKHHYSDEGPVKGASHTPSAESLEIKKKRLGA